MTMTELFICFAAFWFIVNWLVAIQRGKGTLTLLETFLFAGFGIIEVAKIIFKYQL